jgi:HSP20 family protein
MDSLVRSPRRTSLLRSLQDEVDKLFESAFSGVTGEGREPTSTVWTPRMDLVEADGHYRLMADLPGISKNDVSVTVDENRLTIRGEREREAEADAESYVRSERAFGTFHRMIRLPESVDETKIEATFRDGVLSVELPKTEKSKPKTIEIA